MMLVNIDVFVFSIYSFTKFFIFNVVAVLIFWINVVVLFGGVGSLKVLDDDLVK